MRDNTSKLYLWATQKANSTKAPLWICLLFSLEIFLFIPLDAILMFFCLQNQRKTFLYVLLAAFASTISATIGYLIGHFLWDVISCYTVPYLISTSTFNRIANHFQLYENWAVFIGTLLPFPLKALSLLGGVFHLKLIPFNSCVLTARLLRFGVVGGAMLLWGVKVKTFLDRHFQKVLALIGVKVAIAVVFFWAIAR
jgi:membrane protein YqaA with SNARE-associated domain